MPRCPDCQRFVSLDSEQDPEISLYVSEEDGQVTGDVQITNNCAECGTEMYTASLEVDINANDITANDNGQTLAAFIEGLTDQGRENLSLEVDEDGSERTDRFEGKGRGQRHYYGAKVEFTVTARLEPVEGTNMPKIERTFSGTWADDVQASGMDQSF